MGLPGQGAAVAFTASLLLLSACKKEENTYVPPPPPPVGVSQPLNITVTPYIDYTGNTVAVNQVNLEARVEGFLTAIDYVDGTFVPKDKTLFVIEQPPYQAQLAEAEAKLKSLQANRAYAQAQLQRQMDLAPKGFSTQADLDQARAKRDALDADILDAKAGIDIATINLGYTEVKAPFDGVVTNHLQSVGALVGVTSPTQLATIVQIDPIWMTFNMSEQDVLRIRANMAKRNLTLRNIDKVPCEVGLMIEQGFPHEGHLDYAAPEVDPSTGTLLVRCIFENKNRALIPGLFARVRVPLIGQTGQALLVPDVAIGTSQLGRYLLLVDKDNSVEQRVVEVGQLFGNLREITKGLAADDRVVIGDTQRAIPGRKVAPQEAKIAPPPAASVQP
ncbi:MAG TPA: efflux RND transporter periplasmic adaptor subunit [Verrucomicrobiae bacterium]|nr:efflux RND transporter periplasmic adaptor subunit [Verrucomicrobiae bacterium]